MRYEDVHRPQQTIIIDYQEPVKFPWSRDTPVLNRIEGQSVLAQRLILGRNFLAPLYLSNGEVLMDPSVNEVLSLTLLPPSEIHIPLGQYLGYMQSTYPTEYGAWDKLLTFGRRGQAIFARLENFTSLFFGYDSETRSIHVRKATKREESEIEGKLRAKKVQDLAGKSAESETVKGSKFVMHPNFREIHAFVREPSSMLLLEDVLTLGSKSH